MPLKRLGSFLLRPPFILGVVAVLVVSLVAGASHALAAATVAPLVSYQARLMDPSGFPVADGSYSVQFSLYDAPTGGNRLWTASGSTSTPAAISVSVANGLFSVLLGDTGQNTLDSVDWNQDALYIGVTIGADAEMTPRRRLASAPQAFNARQLQGMFASSTAFGANSLFTINQTSNTAATGTRTALEVRSAGTSNSNDFLFRGVNDLASTVFSVNRQGSVTGTGVLAITGSGTSTFVGSVSSTRGEFSVGLTVGGTAVCLASGANCASSGSGSNTSTLADVSARGSFATTTLQLYGGFVGSSSTVTSTLTVLGGTSLQSVTATNATATNVFASGVVSTTRLNAITGTFATATVQGVAVCLSNGSFCPAASATEVDTLATVSARGNFATSTLQLYGGFVGSSSTVTSTFTVLGNITNTLSASRTFLTVSTTQVGGAPYASIISGPFMYVANYLDDQIEIFDISNPASPTSVALHTVGAGPISLFTEGRYLYVVNEGTDNISIVDISNPRRPITVSTHPVGDTPQSIYASGRHVYVANNQSDSVSIIDVSNPSVPVTVATRAVGSEPFSVFVTGRYAYVANSSANTLSILDVTNPANPVSVATPTTGLVPLSVTVSGRYAYVANFGADTVSVFDISNPISPYIVSTISVQDRPSWVNVSGRYLYVANRNDGTTGTISVIDVNDPTNPASVGTVNVGSQPVHVSVAGRYGFVSNNNSNDVTIFDVGGIETNGLEAASANLGSITVFGDGDIANQLGIGGALTVGRGGIFTDGSLAVNSTNTTSTFNGAVSTTNLFVRGRSVCLIDGTNCPSLVTSEVDTLATVSARGNSATTTLQLYGGFVGSSSTVTSTFTVVGGTNLQNVTATNVTTSWLGATTVSTTNLFVNGSQVCLQSGTNCPSSIESDTLALVASRGSFATSTLLLYGGFVGSSSTVTSTLTVLGGTSLQSVTATNVTSSNVFVSGTVSTSQLFVNGQLTCLANGTNCQPGSGTSTNFWVYNSAGDFLRTTTSTSNVVIGGTSTTVGFMHPQFAIDGQDLFVAGNIGSASSVYTNGAFVAGTGTTYYGDGYVTARGENGLRVTASTTRIIGNIDATLDTNTDIRLVTSGNVSGFANDHAVIQGDYMYVTENSGSPDGFQIYSIANRDTLVALGRQGYFNQDPTEFVVQGDYAYIILTQTAQLSIVNISNPNRPFVVATTTNLGLNTPSDIKISGKYLYISSNSAGVENGTAKIVDISEPANPVLLSTISALSIPNNIDVAGKYLFIHENNFSRISVRAYDISDPRNPVFLDSVSSTDQVTDMAVQGSVLHLMGNTYETIDISNPTNMASMDTLPISDGEGTLGLIGRYAIAPAGFLGAVDILDVSNPSDLQFLQTVPSTGSNAEGLAIKGNRFYVLDGGLTQFDVYELPGIEVAGLRVGSADLGMLQVVSDAVISGILNIGGGISIGRGGLYSEGSLAVYATNTTSTFAGTVSTSQLYVGSQLVCLANGVNCPAGGGSGTSTNWWVYNPTGDFLRTTTNTTNVVIGGTSTTVGFMHSLFTLNGQDLFVGGNIGSASSIYTNGGFVAGTGTTVYADGSLSSNRQSYSLSAGQTFQLYASSTNFANFGFNGTQIFAFKPAGGGGGDIDLFAADAQNGSTDVGGNLSFMAGDGDDTGDGGQITLETGTGDNGSSGGLLNLISGAGGVNGGLISLDSGDGDVDGGGINLNAGDGATGEGGSININAGTALNGSTATSGEVIIRSGSSDTFGGRAGSIRLLAGSGSNAIAGDVVITGGDRSSFGGGTAGHVYINGGAFNVGSGIGGDIFLTPGRGSTGIGQVHIRNSGSAFNSATLNFHEIEDNGTDRIGIRAPNDIALNYELTLPEFEGSSGTVLATNGFGIMVFAEVCLADGTGCPAGNSTTETLATVTNRGAFATSTLTLYGGFVGSSSTVTSTLTVVSNTRMLGNAFVGSSTYGGGLNTAFATNGDDLFVAGNIGAASSVYTNGSFIAGSGSTYYSNGLISRQDSGQLRMRTVNGTLALETVAGVIGINPVIGGVGDVVIGGEPDDLITLAGLIDGGLRPNGNNGIDIGEGGLAFRNIYASGTAALGYVSTTLLTVDGNRVCQADGTDCQTTVTASTTQLATVTGGSNPRSVAMRGSYVYNLSAGNTRLNVYNISDATHPLLVTSTLLNASSFPVDLIVKDNYLFISSSVGGASAIQIYELTENGFPRFVRNFSLGLAGPVSLVQHGNAMYVREGSAGVDILNVADVNDITNSSSLSIIDLVDITVHNGYLYTLQESPTNRLKIYSLVNKFAPNLIADFAIDDDASHLRVQDGMAFISYVANATSEPSLRVYDVSNPFAPVLRSSLNVGLNTSGVQAIEVSGRYLYLGRNDGSDGYLHVIDIASSTRPVNVATTTYGSAPISDFVANGKYVIFNEASDLQIVTMGGVDLPSLVAAQAEFGNVMVRGTTDLIDRVTAHGGLVVGTGGIVSTGPLIVDSVATTTFGAYIDQLLVGTNASATGTSNYSMVLTYASSATLGGLCIDDTSTAPTCPSNVGASIMSDGPIVANAFDLAEKYALTGSAEAGDLLVVDQGNTAHVMKSEGIAYDSRVIGIVSTRPGFVLGWEGGAQVALTGRVPLKIAMTNGAIRVGDALTSSNVPGYAMKATKPGMIVGYALQDLSATGTAEAFVNVGYHAATVLGTDGSATQLSDNLVLSAREAASSTNPAVDSWGLTLRGSAWDSLASSVVSREFSLLNDVISSTSSLLTIRNSNGTSIFTMDEAGNASFNGDVQVGGRLFPSSRGAKQDDYYIFLDDQAPTGTYMATNADGWQSMDTYDFAERFYSPDELEPGDLVVVKNTGNHHVQRAWNETDMLVGIVSTRPAFIAGRPATNTHPIALSGRVPTKVSAMKGAIKAGDPLAPSTMPGVAVKASLTGPVVGLALEDYTGDAIGLIEVNVNPGWWTAPVEPVAPQTIVQQVSMEGALRRGMAKIEAGVKKVTVSYESIQSYPFVQVTPRGLIVGAWGTENYTDTGFDIVLAEAQSFDAYFSWQVEPLQAGDRLYQSDGTFLDLNEMTGQPVGGVAPSSTEALPEEPIVAPEEPLVSTTTEPVVEEESNADSVPEASSSTESTP